MDRSAVKRAQRGDQEAFMSLIEEQKTMLYNTALLLLKNEEDVLDAMQDTVLSAWQKLPLLRETGYFRTWLTRILMNKCYDILRGRRYYGDLEGVPEEGSGEDHDLELDVRGALDSLKAEDKLLLSLFYYDGFRVREIALLLGISEGAVKTRLSRSRERFREQYRKDGGVIT